MQAHSQSFPAARVPSHPLRQSALSPPSSAAADFEANLTQAAGLAHDAGNLLAALGLYSEMLSAPGVLAPRHRHYATEIRLIADRSSRLIERLMAMCHERARQEAAKLGQPAPQNPSAERSLPPALPARHRAHLPDVAAHTSLHSAALHNLAPVLERIAAGAAEVSITCSAWLPDLDLSAEVMERITLNLVSNAAEAIRNQRALASETEAQPLGQIRLRLEGESDQVRLTVEDTGPGMSEEMVAAYLRPTPLPHGATRGLGHRVVHQLVAESGGRLAIRVRPGYGTLFCVRWPIRGVSSKTQPSDDASTAQSRNPTPSPLTA